jgi:hypothetical protein
MDANDEGHARRPLTRQSDDDYMAADATDRRVALEQACVLQAAETTAGRHTGSVTDAAEDLYTWLRRRPSLVPVKLTLRHGHIHSQPGF